MQRNSCKVNIIISKTKKNNINLWRTLVKIVINMNNLSMAISNPYKTKYWFKLLTA